MHQSVGIIIRNKKNEILMLDRKNYPYGWACPAGHLNEGEEAETALIRETREETGLTLIAFKLLIHEYVDWNECSYGVRGHDWYVYETHNWKGQVEREDKEAKKIDWIKLEEIKNIKLEPMWEYWFKKLNYSG